jgi:FtsP/CotA-like multicopper oxidase with cupredoxin domain
MAFMLTYDDRDAASPDSSPDGDHRTSGRRDDVSRRDGLGFITWLSLGIALAGIAFALFGLRDDNSATPVPGDAALPTVEASMREFAFEPGMVSVGSGGGIVRFTNTGSSVHNAALPELGIESPDIQPGESYEMRLSSVADGHYRLVCLIPGHEASGMKGTVMVGGGTGGAGSGGSSSEMTNEDMDRVMEAVAAEFPAATEGRGGQPMEFSVAPDGAKVFDVTAEVVDWEVEPGKFVEAWTYNGVVPAPEIRVNSGDQVRIVFTNATPQSTSLHLHGVRVPNSMDGVDPYTQPAIRPGETFTYEFEAKGPAVGIYHSHHNAMEQVPNGMFGAFLIDEMPIPDKLVAKGYTQIDRTVTMVLNDAGTIGLSLNGKSFPATEPYTLKVGEVMMVHYLNEGLMSHPMHLHQPVGWVIAKDGFPLEEPMPSDTISVAPGERYTVLYKAEDPGVWAWHCHILNHAEGPTGMFGMVTALIVEEA